MFNRYTPENWYWNIKEDGRIYASGRGVFVDASDAEYLAFCELSQPTNILNVSELDEVLINNGLTKASPPTAEETIQILTNAVQNLLDATAQTRMYDGIASLASYAGDDDPIFDAEGTAGKAWRSACWRKSRDVMAEVQNGLRLIPTAEELLAEMPVLIW